MEANEARARVIELKRTIAQHESDLGRAESELRAIEDACSHDWGDTVYCPVVTDAYTIPAESRGSDSRPACHVPREEKKRWRRTCSTCGKIETTKRESVKETRTPKF